MSSMGKLIFDQIEPSNRLFSVVLNRIEGEKEKSAKKQAVFFGFMSVISSISVLFAGEYLSTELYKTGFYDFASLFVSDWNSITFFWKEAIISLAESLPVIGFAVLFGTIAVLLESVKIIIKNVVNIDYLKTKTI